LQTNRRRHSSAIVSDLHIPPPPLPPRRFDLHGRDQFERHGTLRIAADVHPTHSAVVPTTRPVISLSAPLYEATSLAAVAGAGTGDFEIYDFSAATHATNLLGEQVPLVQSTARSSFFDRKLHSRMPLVLHACSHQAYMRVTNIISLGWSLLLPTYRLSL
jgi:hypothetical protein